jgi:hypothetical protein
MPICLSDRQSTAVASAAAALPASDRPAFYDAVAHQLTGREIGDGAVHRAVATAFQAFWKPPELPAAKSRWNRERPRFDHASKRDF